MASSSSTRFSLPILWLVLPLIYDMLTGVAPVNPISATFASPGPFTMQPTTDTSIGVVISSSRDSSSFTVAITSKFCLEQLGHATRLTPLLRSPRLFRISKPTLISSTGLAAREIRMVSPIPSINNRPSPTEDFTVPLRKTASFCNTQMQRLINL